MLEYPQRVLINIAQRGHTGRVTSYRKIELSLTSPIQQKSEIFNLEKPIKVSSCILPGLVVSNEKKTCQDSYSYILSHNMLLCALFDGHGPVGEKISGHASAYIVNYFLSNIQKFIENTKESLIMMLEECDKALENTKINYTLSGTTAVVLLLTSSSIHTASLGDSRAVLGTIAEMSFSLPAPSNKYCRTWTVNRVLKPIPLTVDQKPNHEEEFLRIRQAGGCVEKVKDLLGNGIGPYRVWLADQDLPGLAMSRSIGDKVAKGVGVIATPVYHYFTIYHETDQYIVMASDGIWDVFENMEVINFIEKFKDKCEDCIIEDSYPASFKNSNIARLLCEEARYRWFALVEAEDVHIDDISCIIIDISARSNEKLVAKKERNVKAFQSLALPNEYKVKEDPLKLESED